MLFLHVGSVFAVAVGCVLIYVIGLGAGYRDEKQEPKWHRWPILFVVGLIASFFVALGALLAFAAVASLLRDFGIRQYHGEEELEAIIWYFLAFPLYTTLFLVGAYRSQQTKQPNPTLEEDAREGGARPSP